MIDLHNKKIGLALGGGGVKGLAHIALLKRLDEKGLRPTRIAGTSMGAIIGALYAAGISGQEIENRVRDHIIHRGDKLKDIYRKRSNLFRWATVFSFGKSRGGFFAADGLFRHLFSELVDLDFKDLQCPFSAIACDFHSGEEVVIEHGKVIDAIRASMAVPGIFIPQRIDGKLLVDGGLVNNLPCDHILADTDFRIACDVISLVKEAEPSAMQALSGALSIMLLKSTQATLASATPDLLLKVDTDGIEAFDFHKIEDVLARGEMSVRDFDTLLQRGEN